MKTYLNVFETAIAPQSLFSAWDAFRKGKSRKRDVMAFEYKLEQNIFALHHELRMKTYRHGGYADFYINDPKRRHIHKASVRDRVLHHAVYSALNPIFEETFIYDSYSCRVGKGTHRGIDRLRTFMRRVSRNNHFPCFALKCDISQFFASVDHAILVSLIERRVPDADMLWLIREIIGSFAPGIPLGNLTSQLFANIYLNELDQFVKHGLKIPFCLRYTDDFVVINRSLAALEAWLPHIRQFLTEHLKLELHPRKIIFRKYHQGTDFLGYVQLPHHRMLRTKTRRRIVKRIASGVSHQALQSYLGMLSHANGFKLSEALKNVWWLSHSET